MLLKVCGVAQDTAQDLTEMLERVKETIVLAQEEEGEVQELKPWVHQGFLTSYDSIRPQILSIVDALLADRMEQEMNTKKCWSVYVTGHSLGGALATLCAYDLAARRHVYPTPHHLALYNFGSPRVGNRAFAKEFNRLVPDAWRIVNRNDAVCSVPRLMGYCHVGHAVKLKDEGTVEVQLDTSDVLGEGLAATEVLDAALPKLTGRIIDSVGVEVSFASSIFKDKRTSTDGAPSSEPMKPDKLGSEVLENSQSDSRSPPVLSSAQVDNLLEQEYEAWSLLLNGSSLNEHLEDGVGGYLSSLRNLAEVMACKQELNKKEH